MIHNTFRVCLQNKIIIQLNIFDFVNIKYFKFSDIYHNTSLSIHNLRCYTILRLVYESNLENTHIALEYKSKKVHTGTRVTYNMNFPYNFQTVNFISENKKIPNGHFMGTSNSYRKVHE